MLFDVRPGRNPTEEFPSNLVFYVSILALLTATALRFISLGRQSLWTDEIFSVYWAKSGVDFMFAHLRDETNPPLYYLILEMWMRVFGDSEAAVRLLSALLSAITVPIVYLLGKSIFGRQAGGIAALLYALSYWNLNYAGEARSYVLLNFTFALMLQCVQGIVTALRRGARPLSAVRGGYGIGFLLAAVASACTNYVSTVIFGALGVAITLIWWRPFAFERRFLICFAVLGVSAALIISPIMFIAVAERHSANISWIVQPSLRECALLAMGTPEVYGWFRRFSQGTAVILWAPLLVYGAWRHRDRIPLFLVYLFPLIGFGMLVFVSFITPILLNRTAIWISIPVYLGLAGAVSAMKYASARRLITGIILLSSLVSAGGYFVYSAKEPWRSLIPEIAARVSAQDLVILGNDTPAIAFLYYHGADVVPALRRWPANITASDILDEYATGIRPISSDEITTALSAGRPIVFMSRKCAVPIGFDPTKVILRPSYCDGR